MVYLSQVELSKLLEFIAPGLMLSVLLATTCSGDESTLMLLPDGCVLYLAMAGWDTFWTGAVYPPIGSNRASWQGGPRCASLDALGGSVFAIIEGYLNYSSSTHKCECSSCRQGMTLPSFPFWSSFVAIMLVDDILPTLHR